MNTTRIVVIGLVALALGILVGVGFQGSISQVLNLNAAAPTADQVFANAFDHQPDPATEAKRIATIKDELLNAKQLRIFALKSSSAGMLTIIEPKAVTITTSDGNKYTNFKWQLSVLDECFNSTQEDRIKAIMQSTGKPRPGAIMQVLIEMAQTNKDDQLSMVTNGWVCRASGAINR